MSVNQVVLSGRLVDDPKPRSAGQHKIATMSLAVQANGPKKTTSFFALESWNKTAEIIVENFVKGSQLSFIGHLKQENYQTKEGKTVNNTVVAIDQILNIPARQTVAVSSDTVSTEKTQF